jgi:hypothetical protein
MTEIHFLIEKAADGSFLARALGAEIFTQADTLPELDAQVRDAVSCHFAPECVPSLIHLHMV